MLLPLCCAVAWSGPWVLDFSTRAPPRPPLRVGAVSGPVWGTGGGPNVAGRMAEFGITLVRNNDYYDDRLDIEGVFNCGGKTYPSWQGCDARRDRYYDWQSSDELMAAIEEGGLEPMLRLGGEYNNPGRPHDFKGPQNATQERNWITAATKVASRYRGQYTYLDLWTEFPGAHFWDRGNDDFYRFWGNAYTALKAAIPEARLGGPGLSPRPTRDVIAGKADSVAVEFLAALYARKIRPDWIGWHLFANDAGDFRAAGLGYRDLLEGRGPFSGVPWAGTGFFAGVELLVDAFSPSPRESGGEGKQGRVDREEAAALYGGARGAAVVASTLVALQSTDCTRAYYYRANDPPAKGNEVHLSSRGLFGGDPQATPKKPAQAVRLWSALAAGYPTIEAVSVPRDEGPWAVLARSPEGGRAVYVANPGTEAVTLGATGRVEFGDAGGSEQWLVSETDDGTSPRAVPAGDLVLPGYSVALVVIP